MRAGPMVNRPGRVALSPNQRADNQADAKPDNSAHKAADDEYPPCQSHDFMLH